MHSNLRFSKAMYATAGMVFLAGIGTAFHPLTAKGIGNDVVMERNTPLMDVIAQAKKITGKVTDDQGEPLPGATVRVKGTTNGTVTDIDGNFSIEVEEGAVLQVSFVGFVAQEVPIGNQASLSIQLVSDATQLDEMVVVGYGTQKRSDITGAIGSVKEGDFNKGVISNPVDLLQGKMAGVNITSTSGEPGAAQNVIIRGVGSLRSGTQPLYVLDGFLLDNADTGIASNPLNFLNPGDIESIEVLKDASATALYGSRASNGVVVITTKKGKSGATQMNLSASTAWSSMANKIDVFSADEFREQVVAVGGDLEDFGGNTDWQDELTQVGLSKNINFSMSGSNTSNFSYFASLGYQDQEGILKNSELERFSGKLNMNQKAFDGRLNVDYNLTASHTKNLRPSIGSTISDMLSLNPTVPTYTDGEPTLLNTNALNPLKRYELYSDDAANNRILATISPSFEIVDGLTYKLNLGVDYSSTNRYQQYRPYSGVINESNISDGTLDEGISENTNKLVENTLTYNWHNYQHNLTVLAGHSYQTFLDEYRLTSARGFADNNIEPRYQDHNSTSEYPTTVSSSAVKNELQSFFARVNYTFDEKYLFTGTFRADGSSKFGENNKYGYFPSFALGWNITKEDFMSNSFFDNLKLRASWGQTGNQEIPSKITKASYSEDRLSEGNGSLNTYPIDTDATTLDGYPYGIVFTRLANPDLQWEVSTQIDFGIDFAFFNHRLTGTLDYFNKVSSNILLEVVPADPVEPTPTYWDNIENMKIHNSGIELALDYASEQRGDFSYAIGGNVTFINNEVKDSPYSVLTTGAAQGAGQTGATINGYINGEPIGAFYMLQFDGISEDGVNRFKDVNGDGEVLDNDRAVVGSAIPKVIYGAHMNFNYKAFDLGLNFNGSAGSKVYNHTTMSLFTKAQLSRSNNTTDFATQYPEESFNNSNTVSTRFLENGSYFRLNNATLGYNLNSALIGLGDAFQNIRISVTGQNLFVITDYSGFDPEVNTGSTSGGIQTFGIDRFTYPRARTYSINLNLTF
ncbi:SusC/RagA family TonB-linked outer membrane protein [Echinicola vietnamensis]|uniref:TonB-linked outer membrane protein, SusC/RagA family n=1 Tax=Echinicola vietnamensis (strain DSM 17526 / LMG 23754 / KMM 6221) TaxID=926556 RepID=L0FS38_ECHVK|nr:TonB-dependent receptor [Echinicola vietnamensis]AGA76754.1 TonB-linked outer membrane protein, SusC/RagA family [Echinicola vietnamensis DSM 17526]